MGSASRSSFFGFEIAKTGLFISQHNLNVTGHNISNVNTAGYTRQRLVTSAIEPYSTIGRLATYEKGILGGGTTSHYIEQLRSDYLDREFRLQNSNVNTWAARLESLEFIEQIFDEPNEVGVLKHLQDFHNAISDLATDSAGQSQRTALQSAAKKLTETFNQYYRQLVDQQVGLNEQVEAKVDQVNRLTAAIGELNKLIYNFEMAGTSSSNMHAASGTIGEQANDLRDSRNVLLDQLSSLVQIEVKEYRESDNEPPRLSVTMGSGASKGYLVDHTTVNKLYTQEVDNRIQGDADNKVGAPLEKVTVIMWGDPTPNGADAANPNDPPIDPAPGAPAVELPVYNYRDRGPNTHIPTANTANVYISDAGEAPDPSIPGDTGEAPTLVYGNMAAYNGEPPDPEAPYYDNYRPPTNVQMEAMYEMLGEGEIKGLLTMRDGDHSENVGIPYLVHQLDRLARAIVKEFNEIHNAGYCDPKAPGGSVNNIDFFYDLGMGDYTGTDPEEQAAYEANALARITSGTFTLDDGMTDPNDVWRIACSDVPVDANQEGNNHNTIDRLLARFDAEDVGDVSNFSKFYNSFLLTVGFETDFARTQETNMETLAVSADTQRMSISAVSIDEEMVNMVKYQHAFAASSRVITAMDEALNTIINGMGVVGR